MRRALAQEFGLENMTVEPGTHSIAIRLPRYAARATIGIVCRDFTNCFLRANQS